MSDEILGDRRKALEEQFFHKQDAELIERLRAQREGAERREALAAVSGIEDPATLDRLVDSGISPDTLAALRLVPLVATAWADGKIDAGERKAVLRAAASCGIAPGTSAHTLLDGWLGRRPAPELVSTWVGYVQALPDAVRSSLREELLDQARRVARATGGFLGLGSKISPDEKRVLSELERAFG